MLLKFLLVFATFLQSFKANENELFTFDQQTERMNKFNLGRHQKSCSNPLGLPGHVYYDGCDKFTCQKIRRRKYNWVKGDAREFCCSYLDDMYLPGEMITSFISSDNCSQVTLTCQIGPSISGDASTFNNCNIPWFHEIDSKLTNLTSLLTEKCETTSTTTATTTTCAPLNCDSNATEFPGPSFGFPCGYCECNPGFVGPGYLCGPDNDNDGWSDISLNCYEVSCTQDNCVGYPNSGQEDADGDGEGDACDNDSDNDGVDDGSDNCPLVANAAQTDTDNDNVGDDCDNCMYDYNDDQANYDYDMYGDVCDDDIDNDGVLNTQDNCVFFPNPQQTDTDGDGVGDDCDSCPNDSNPDQLDLNGNGVGDACDDGIDSDKDGVPDQADNCPNDANADQLDSDADGSGDACDDDQDNDGVLNAADNCPIVYNPSQADSNSNGVGDECENDCDGDGINDQDDVCPCNNYIGLTDFRGVSNLSMGENGYGQPQPNWEFRDEGKEILQFINSAPGIAIGKAKLQGVQYEGTMFVRPNWDDDWIGAVFSFQDTSNFYLFMSSRAGSGQGPWQIKRINSVTGPVGTNISSAIQRPWTVSGQTELLWIAPGSPSQPTTYQPKRKRKRKRNKDDPTADQGVDQSRGTRASSLDGWNENTSYRFEIVHIPEPGLIRLRLWEGATLLHAANVSDTGEARLRGGRLGVYCDSQQEIVWSALSYRCIASP